MDKFPLKMIIQSLCPHPMGNLLSGEVLESAKSFWRFTTKLGTTEADGDSFKSVKIHLGKT